MDPTPSYQDVVVLAGERYPQTGLVDPADIARISELWADRPWWCEGVCGRQIGVHSGRLLPNLTGKPILYGHEMALLLAAHDLAYKPTVRPDRGQEPEPAPRFELDEAAAYVAIEGQEGEEWEDGAVVLTGDSDLVEFMQRTDEHLARGVEDLIMWCKDAEALTEPEGWSLFASSADDDEGHGYEVRVSTTPVAELTLTGGWNDLSIALGALLEQQNITGARVQTATGLLAVVRNVVDEANKLLENAAKRFGA